MTGVGFTGYTGQTKKMRPGGGQMVSSAMGGVPTAFGGGRKAGPSWGAMPPPPPGFGGGGYGAGGGVMGFPPNPTGMTTYGPYSQQQDLMGRVITTTPGVAPGLQFNPLTGAMEQGGVGPGAHIEDPDAQRRARDRQDLEHELALKKKYAPKEEDWESIDFDSLLAKFGGGGPREPPQITPTRVTGEPEADRRAAEAAEFGRAKDRVAKIAGGAARSMAAASAGQGRAGIDARNMRDIIRSGQGDLASVATEQAIESLKRRNAVADRNYQGDITQRAQDIGIGGANLGAGVTQRGQDISARSQLLSVLPGLLKGRQKFVFR